MQWCVLWPVWTFTTESCNCTSGKWHQPSLKDSLNSRKPHKQFLMLLWRWAPCECCCSSREGWVVKGMPVVLRCWLCWRAGRTVLKEQLSTSQPVPGATSELSFQHLSVFSSLAAAQVERSQDVRSRASVNGERTGRLQPVCSGAPTVHLDAGRKFLLRWGWAGGDCRFWCYGLCRYYASRCCFRKPKFKRE